MVDRVVGQLSLADGLVSSDETVFDRVGASIDWGPVRALLGRRSGPGPGGWSYPAEVLLRATLLGIWHGGLSDPALEAQLRDRISFRRFVGLSMLDTTPDHTTLWRFRDELSRDGTIERLLEEINRQLDEKGLILRQGTLVDATFLQARARPPRAPRKGAAGPVKPSADPDARWGKKGSKSVFGYKMHIGVDGGHTLIRRVEVSDASVTDTEAADALISWDEAAVYGDKAYSTHERTAALRAKTIRDRLMHRPNRHHPVLPARKQRHNRMIAKVRSAVERPFAVFKERYGMRRLRAFSLAANRTICLLAACAYNLRRSLDLPTRERASA